MGTTDVLIVCALKEELDALLEVRAGVSAGWTRQAGDPEYWTATLDGTAGPVRVAAARATAMGGVVAAELVTRLTMQLEPRCLAMCGVCAGHPDDTDLGDVIIADRVFQHDNGKLTEDGFRGDLTTHMPDDRWVRVAQGLAGAAREFHGYGEPDEAAAKWWFLERLYTGRHPRKSGFERYFAGERRATLLEQLISDKLVRLRGEDFTLTKKGRESAANRRAIHGAPVVVAPYHIHVGPIGSGNYVQARDEEWDQIAERGMRKLAGVEMEVAAIGVVAYRHRKPFIVAKAVMDHGDTYKAERFKAFAARASAEVLCAFLRRVVEPTSTTESPVTPTLPGPGEDKSWEFHLRVGPLQLSVGFNLFEGPAADANFTGREKELADLEQLVQAHRTVCIVATGIGGIGKTTLVAEFAATRGRELFPDGIAWIDASPEQFLGELGRVCRRFGWADDRGPTPDEAQQHLKARLADQRVLLVVDNLDPAKTLPKYVPIPGGKSRTLVTSRTRTLDLDLDAQRIELGVWPLAACRYYLRSRCERLTTVPDAEVDALADFVGRLPLGVKLLVSVLRHRAGTSTSDLLDQLRAQPLGTLDKYDQDRGVAATFQAAYDDLPEPKRRVLRALAVCAGQTHRGVVSAVSELDDAGEHLDDLHTRGFAELSRDKSWGMHNAVRMFVLEQPGCEVFEQHHIVWVREHLKTHADPAAHHEFAKGVDESRHALARLLGSDLDAAMAIYSPLQKHLRDVGRYPEAMEVSKLLLSVAPQESPQSAVAFNNLGLCYRVLGDIPKAIEMHERSLAIDEKLGRLPGQADALGNLGVCAQVLGDIPKAIELHEWSLAIDETLSRLQGQASTLGNLGLCYRVLGDIPKAIELLERSLAIDEKLGRLQGQASQIGNLAGCYEVMGDIPKAIELLERSLAIEEKLGRLEGQSSDLGNLGACYQALGDIPKAIELHERSLAINEKLGHLEGRANQIGNLGLCYQALGNIPKAIDMLERSLAINEKLGRLEGQAIQLGGLAACYGVLGDIPKAVELLERSLSINEKLGRLEGQAIQHGNLGSIAKAQGDTGRARKHLTRARDIFQQIGLPDTHPHLVVIDDLLNQLR